MILKKRKHINIKKLLYKIFIGDTPTKKLILFYLYAIITGVVLLLLPISLKHPSEYVIHTYDGTTKPYTFWDALFTAISAFSDTGLSSFVIRSSYNVFGQIVLALLIQTGGIGLFTIYWMFWKMIFNNIFFKKLYGNRHHRIGFSSYLLISSERGNTKLGLSNQTIKAAVIFIFTTELIFACFYSLWFGLYPAYDQVTVTNAPMIVANTHTVLNNSDWVVNSDKLLPTYHHAGWAIWSGIFQSISTMNNAGFDVLGNSSMSPFRNGAGTIFQLVVILQFILGGIGYPVIYDMIEWIKSRHHHTKFIISLFSKVSLTTYFIVAFIGLFLMIGFEYGMNSSIIYKVNNTEQLKNIYFGSGAVKGWNEFMYVFFNSFSTRSAGFATITENDVSQPAKWVIIMMMFIGCAPSSTGGGIRTTTLAIIFMSLISKAKGYKDVRVFKRSIPRETVISSFLITFISFGLVIGFALISYPLEKNSMQPGSVSMLDSIFEFASAYGTVGLTDGISPTLFSTNVNSVFVCLFLCIVMIIGQLGIPSSIFIFKKKKTETPVYYPVEDIRVG